TERTLTIVVIPAKAVGCSRVPGIPNDEERSAVRLLDGMLVPGSFEKSTTKRFLLLLGFAPRDSMERTTFSTQSGIRRIGTAMPRPISCGWCQQADAKRPVAIPKAVDSFLEARTG